MVGFTTAQELFGLLDGVSGGSNGYLLGLRYRWGRDTHQAGERTMMPPLPECEDPDRNKHVKPSSLSERLESIALGDGGEPSSAISIDGTTDSNKRFRQAQQQAMRTEGDRQDRSTHLRTSLQRAASASNNAEESPFNAEFLNSG